MGKRKNQALIDSDSSNDSTSDLDSVSFHFFCDLTSAAGTSNYLFLPIYLYLIIPYILELYISSKYTDV